MPTPRKTLQLFDTLTREVHSLTPRDGDTYRFYCCGPTVYGPAHVGNFRTFVLQDVFRRTLELTGTHACHVRNLTDVDDKTIRESEASGMTLTDFTDRWRDRFHEDCAKLNLLAPHHEPSAVSHIEQQVDLIATLIEKEHAYASEDGSVYFRVASFDGYGKLSRLDQRELRAGASGAAVTDSDEYEKDSVSDFALWKGRKPEDGDNYWASPWGEGRPGWHLECSAMCKAYLGDTFDLHSGGVDLVFPHHENEIAQSEAANGERFADHWFHITHLMVDGGKMSKSLQNFYTIEEIEAAGFTAGELRYVLMSANYRQPLNFVARDGEGNETFPALAGAHQAIEKLGRAAEQLREAAGAKAEDDPDFATLCTLEDGGAFEAAWEGILNDLNTPDALGRTFSGIKSLKIGDLTTDAATAHLHGLLRILAALGVALPEPDAAGDDIPEEVRALADKRWDARQGKDWATADAMRDELAALGWAAKDGTDGYSLERL